MSQCCASRKNTQLLSSQKTKSQTMKNWEGWFLCTLMVPLVNCLSTNNMLFLNQLSCSETILCIWNIIISFLFLYSCSYRIKLKSCHDNCFWVKLQSLLMLYLTTDNCCLQNGHVFQTAYIILFVVKPVNFQFQTQVGEGIKLYSLWLFVLNMKL